MTRLLLSEILPLRTTRMLGDFAESTPLPEILGDLTEAPFPLIRLTPTRYFAADHPMPITGVYIDRQISYGWQRVTESDGAGATYTIVAFTSPIDPQAEVSATGTGRRNASTGSLIANPADAIDRVCAIAGRDDDWSGLRAECSRLNLRVAGRIAEAQTVRAQIDDIARSVGAIWAPGMARLYPSLETPNPVLDLHTDEVSDIEVSASITDTADVLRLSYDYSDAQGMPRHYLELTASPQRYGGLIAERVHAWLRDAQCAEIVGRAGLSRLAGERYEVALITSNIDVRPGMWVRLVDCPGWPLTSSDPVLMVLQADIEPHAETVSIRGEYLASAPTITVTAHSVALPDAVAAGLAVEFRNGVATFTITDDNGRPIAGALVSLDGGAPKTTDARGQVSFSTTAGEHEIAATAPGFVPFTIRITL